MAITSKLPPEAFPLKSQLFQRSGPSAVDWSVIGSDGQAYHAFYAVGSDGKGQWFGWESAGALT